MQTSVDGSLSRARAIEGRGFLQAKSPRPTDVAVIAGSRHDDLCDAVARAGYIPCPMTVENGTAAALASSACATLVCDSTDGALDVCRRLASQVPLALVTDETSFGFRLASMRAGVTSIIRRPIDHIELAEWLSAKSASEMPAGASVVIVDDDRLAAEVNAAVLRSVGMTVKTTSDPAEALRVIEEREPDIVLMDLRMPGVDGIELARVIRQSRRFAFLPILFLSADRDERRHLAARRLGGDDFIVKPVPADRLVSTVGLRVERSIVLRSLVERDGLTGLLDQVRFRERIEQELLRCRRLGTLMSVVIIDVDRFKGVNDRHGHAAGDAVLCGLAATLRGAVRNTDAIGRCGGEEFGIVLLDCDGQAAAQVAERARGQFSHLEFQGKLGPFRVTFSAGVASSTLFGTASDLMKAADAALYRAKRDGRNLVRIAMPPIESVDARQSMTTHPDTGRR